MSITTIRHFYLLLFSSAGILNAQDQWIDQNFRKGVEDRMIMMVLPVVLTLLVASVIITLAQKAVLFSKITFALVGAFLVHEQVPIGSGGIVGYLIWFAVFLAGCLLLCMLPRINYAFLFLCDSFITYIVSSFAVSTTFSILGYEYEPTIATEIAIKIVCLIVSISTLLRQIKSTETIKDTKIKFLIFVQRIIASLLYAIAFFILICLSMNSVYKFSAAVNIMVFALGFVLTFVLDVVLFDRMRDLGNKSDPLSFIDSGNVNLMNPFVRRGSGNSGMTEIDRMEQRWDDRELELDMAASDEYRYQEEQNEKWHNDWMDQAARDREDGYY